MTEELSAAISEELGRHTDFSTALVAAYRIHAELFNMEMGSPVSRPHALRQAVAYLREHPEELGNGLRRVIERLDEEGMLEAVLAYSAPRKAPHAGWVDDLHTITAMVNENHER